MSFAYLRVIQRGDVYSVVELIAMTPIEGVPPRPTPGPTPPVQPPLDIWGPSDPRPTLPIAGWDPIHGNWPEFPTPPSNGTFAAVFDVPAGATPPRIQYRQAGYEGSQEQGTDGPSWAYIGPYLQHN